MLDANVKLIRRADLLASMELQSHLSQAAFQLPLDPSGNHLFGEGLAEILALNEDYVSKSHTRHIEQALVKAISSKQANPKQAHSQHSQAKQNFKEKGKVK